MRLASILFWTALVVAGVVCVAGVGSVVLEALRFYGVLRDERLV